MERGEWQLGVLHHQVKAAKRLCACVSDAVNTLNDRDNNTNDNTTERRARFWQVQVVKPRQESKAMDRLKRLSSNGPYHA